VYLPSFRLVVYPWRVSCENTADFAAEWLVGVREDPAHDELVAPLRGAQISADSCMMLSPNIDFALLLCSAGISHGQCPPDLRLAE